MNIKLLVDGGAMKPGPALSQKLGPTGVNVNQVLTKVNESTKKFSGMKVPVDLEIDMGTKEITVHVSSPPVSGMLKKEIGVEKGSGSPLKVKIGNLSIEQVISIAKAKYSGLLARNMKSAVKEVVGTCVSLGILVESKHAKEVQADIDSGKYDKEILAEKTETSPEKREKLDKFFNEMKAAQEKLQKQEEAAKAAAAAAATPAPGTAAPPTAAPAAAAAKAPAKPAAKAPAKGK